MAKCTDNAPFVCVFVHHFRHWSASPKSGKSGGTALTTVLDWETTFPRSTGSTKQMQHVDLRLFTLKSDNCREVISTEQEVSIYEETSWSVWKLQDFMVCLFFKYRSWHGKCLGGTTRLPSIASRIWMNTGTIPPSELGLWKTNPLEDWKR